MSEVHLPHRVEVEQSRSSMNDAATSNLRLITLPSRAMAAFFLPSY